jgi:phage gp45-like
MIREAFRRLRHLLSIARTTAAPIDSGTIQLVQIQIYDRQVRDHTPVMFHFGFTACLPVGTDVAVLAINGDLSNAFVAGSNNQTFRPKNLQPGEAMLYDAFGKSVKLTAAGGIVVETNGSYCTVNGDLRVTGEITGKYGTGNFVTLTGHRHDQAADSHGDSEQRVNPPVPGI